MLISDGQYGSMMPEKTGEEIIAESDRRIFDASENGIR